MLKRAAENEAARIQGKTIVQVLWDLDAFFDTLQLSTVSVAASQSSFPSAPLALAFQAHTAPRVLTTRAGAVSKPLSDFSCSILAGCTSSTSMARAPVNQLINHVCAEVGDTGVKHGQHVDDISQTIAHSNPDCAVSAAVRAASSFAHHVVASGLPSPPSRSSLLLPRALLEGLVLRLKGGVFMSKPFGEPSSSA